MTAHAEFLEELIRLREQAGLSRADLAQRLGIDERAVARGEMGSWCVGIVELQFWVFACGSTLEDFGRRLVTRQLQE